VQSPPSSDPQARNFVPGPFNVPRLKDTYESTFAADLMTLGYTHIPPGTPARAERIRLREWDDSSPYMKNRPLRGPRGGTALPLLERDINWRNIPKVKAVSLNAFVPKAAQNDEYLQIARMAIQAISGCAPEVTSMKAGVNTWNVREGDKTGAKTMIYGDAAYEFLDKLVNLVLPKIKEWPGISGMRASYGNFKWTTANDMNRRHWRQQRKSWLWSYS
jgi:large subunit ribosomal protein L5